MPNTELPKNPSEVFQSPDNSHESGINFPKPIDLNRENAGQVVEDPNHLDNKETVVGLHVAESPVGEKVMDVPAFDQEKAIEAKYLESLLSHEDNSVLVDTHDDQELAFKLSEGNVDIIQ